MSRIGIGIAFAMVMVSLPAQAGERYSLDHSAPPGCPSAEELRLRVLARERSPTVTTRSTAPPASVRVRIVSSSNGPRGWVEVEAAGYRVVRKVEGSNCDEVTSAIAVIIGIALDRRATPPAIPAAIPAPLTLVARRHFVLGGGIMMHDAPAPDPIAGPLAVLGFQRLDGLAPTASLSLGHARSGWIPTEGGQVRFWFTNASLAACPWRWVPHAATALGPCLRVDVGTLRGRGKDTSHDRGSTGPWLAPGGSFDWMLRIEHLALGASAGASLPLIRDRFGFEPLVREHPAHKPPSTDVRAEVWAALSIGK
ncbi:MAG: hypothetical protein JW751_10845 [Polyangiaceae bacterium]|nr:hypothetical protein [Polyangiaceae bacterium]